MRQLHFTDGLAAGRKRPIACREQIKRSRFSYICEAAALKRGGRLVYVGAGTSGRIAIQDGAELRPMPGAEPQRRAAWLSPELKRTLASLTQLGPGILVEDKGYSLALHYRLAPDLGPALAGLGRVRRLLLEWQSGFSRNRDNRCRIAEPVRAFCIHYELRSTDYELPNKVAPRKSALI